MSELHPDLPPALAALVYRGCDCGGDSDPEYRCRVCETSDRAIVATLRAVAEYSEQNGGLVDGEVASWADTIEGGAK